MSETSLSYRRSRCCGGQDCDMLGVNPGEPCWGQVELTSPGDDEDGWPIPGHLCAGHAGAYDYDDPDADCSYRPEPKESNP